jgi:hypothetical protein
MIKATLVELDSEGRASVNVTGEDSADRLLMQHLASQVLHLELVSAEGERIRVEVPQLALIFSA